MSTDPNIGLEEKSQEIKKKSLKVVYGNFIPNEKVTINLILSKAEKPEIDLRSDSSLGQDSSKLVQTTEKNNFLNQLSEKIVPLSAVFIGLLMTWVYLKSKVVPMLSINSRNNAGFVLVHSGLTDQAEKIFLLAVDHGDYSKMTLSNLALCQAIKGNVLKAEALLKATDFDVESKHGKAVVLFNKALIKLIENDKQAAFDKLKEAIHLSPKEIRKYCKLSILLNEVRTDPFFYELIKDS